MRLIKETFNPVLLPHFVAETLRTFMCVTVYSFSNKNENSDNPHVDFQICDFCRSQKKIPGQPQIKIL